MRVLIGCEFSGTVRRAFRARGHEAWSCDLLPVTDGSPYHLQADLNYVLNYPDRVLGGMPSWMRHAEWDLLIAHPPCTYLTNAGVRWLYTSGTVRSVERWDAMEEGAAFFNMCMNARIPRIAVENPIMHAHARALISRPYDQVIQPWQYGHQETKATCLWLKNLNLLRPTNVVGPPPTDPIARRSWAKVHRASPGPDRWKVRSLTYQGIADAMAEQWGRE